MRSFNEIRTGSTRPPLLGGPFRLFSSSGSGRAITPDVLSNYLASMIETYDKLAAAPFNMALPTSSLIDTYVVPPEDLVGCAASYDIVNHTILLPSTTRRPNYAEDLRSMAALARHEVSHAVFHLPLDGKFASEGWHWLCEGAAVWVETLFPGDVFLEDAGLWIDYPEASLRTCKYQSFPFVSFFTRRLGQAALTELWKSSHYSQDSWEAILDIVSKYSHDRESFFADYCLDSYIPDIYDEVMGAIHSRFGHRKAEDCSSMISGGLPVLSHADAE